MYALTEVYGKKAWDRWRDLRKRVGGGQKRSSDLSLEDTKQKCKVVAAVTWEIAEYRSLQDAVAFLGTMNKRLQLYFRGQASDHGTAVAHLEGGEETIRSQILPSLYREKWYSPWDGQPHVITGRRKAYYNNLKAIGAKVYEICDENLGVPRFRGIRGFPEAQWAIIQHDELWPTPMVDVSTSLRVATTFALTARDMDGRQVERPSGFVYVVGLPNMTGSVTHVSDDQLVLARLYSVCPPAAMRPRYQDGYLVGRFPQDTATQKTADLGRRLIAKFRLSNTVGTSGKLGSFWNGLEAFGPILYRVLFPDQDDTMFRALQEMGPELGERIRDLES